MRNSCKFIRDWNAKWPVLQAKTLQICKRKYSKSNAKILAIAINAHNTPRVTRQMKLRAFLCAVVGMYACRLQENLHEFRIQNYL